MVGERYEKNGNDDDTGKRIKRLHNLSGAQSALLALRVHQQNTSQQLAIRVGEGV